MMKSLLQLTLDYVGHHQKIFTLHSITALPYPIQEKFLVYLNAHDLYILSEKQPNHLSDKTLDHVWNLHVQRRWTRAQIVMNIFHDTGLNGNPKLVYLQKYFLEILSYCSINLNTVDPISLFHCPLHKMNRPWPSDSTPNDHNDLTLHIQDLMKFSKYAETLTIIGSQCSWIYVNQDLLNALKSVTKIIQIQAVNDTYFESIIGLLQTLINHGKVTHAVFSMVNLTCQNLSYLMQICAGIHIHSKGSNDSLTLHDQELQCKRLKTDMNSQHIDENNEPIPSTSFDEEMLASVPYPRSSCNHCQDQYCLDLEVESQELFPVDTSLDHDEPQVKDQGDEIDLFDEAVTPLPSKDPVVVRQIVNADGSHICLKGLTTFALLNTNSHYKENFGRVLVDVLPHWKSLTKFAIFDIDSESEDLMNGIVKKLEDHQLTHLVIDDANLNQTFFERLLCTFKDHYKISEDEETVHKALELLDFQACLKSLTAENVVHFEGQIKGIYKLDLSMTTILDSGFTLLLELVRNDTALRHLKLNGCFLREDQVLQLLSVLSVTKQMETLGLSGNRVREQDVETELIKFINSNKQLKTLILNYSRLSCQFVDSEMFTMAVTTHPSLRELSIKSNHLKETSCRLLKKICCSMKPCSLRSLNIGYNWVKGAELVAVAKDITQFRESHDLCEQALDFLCLSGNRLYLSDSSQSKVWMMFNGLVKDLECDRIDYERPFEEHIAQM